MAKKKKNDHTLNTIGLIIVTIILALFLTIFYYQPHLLRGALLLSDETSTEDILAWAEMSAEKLPQNIKVAPDNIDLKSTEDTQINIFLTNLSLGQPTFNFYKESLLFIPGSSIHWTLDVESTSELKNGWYQDNIKIPLNLSKKIKEGSQFVIIISGCEEYQVDGQQTCDIKDYFIHFKSD